MLKSFGAPFSSTTTRAVTVRPWSSTICQRNWGRREPRKSGHKQHRRGNQDRVVEIRYQFARVIFLARAICNCEEVQKPNPHAAPAVNVRIAPNNRKETAEPDEDVKNASTARRWLYCHASHFIQGCCGLVRNGP